MALFVKCFESKWHNLSTFIRRSKIVTENIINFRADGHFTIHSEYMNFKGSLFLWPIFFQKQCTMIRPESFLLMKWSIMIENCQKNLMLLSDSSTNKVHIFWEGHKILRKLPLTFDCMYCSQKLGEDFAKFCGLLQICIWTLYKCPIF